MSPKGFDPEAQLGYHPADLRDRNSQTRLTTEETYFLQRINRLKGRIDALYSWRSWLSQKASTHPLDTTEKNTTNHIKSREEKTEKQMLDGVYKDIQQSICKSSSLTKPAKESLKTYLDQSTKNLFKAHAPEPAPLYTRPELLAEKIRQDIMDLRVSSGESFLSWLCGSSTRKINGIRGEIEQIRKGFPMLAQSLDGELDAALAVIKHQGRVNGSNKPVLVM